MLSPGGYPDQQWNPYAGIPEVGASVYLSLDLPASFGNFVISGTDYEINTDGYGSGVSSCRILVTGGSVTAGADYGGSCNTPAFTYSFAHSPGTPVSVDFSFGNSVDTFDSGYTEIFTISVADSAATPEPSSLTLLVLPLGFILWQRRRPQIGTGSTS